MSDRRTRCRIGVDVGGTFTDVVLNEGGTLRTGKVSSVPEDPSRGFFDGIERMIEGAGLHPESVALVFHGSTVATNAILEGRGARTGMLVTDGFKYVLEIGRAEIPRHENLFAWVKPKRPVPPRLIAEVPERILLDGTVEHALDEARCRARRAGAGRGGGGGGRHRLPARLGEPGPRTPSVRDRPGRAAGGGRIAFERGPSPLPGVRAVHGHGAQCAGSADRRPLRRPHRVGSPGTSDRGAVLRDEVERRNVFAP